MWCTRQVDAVPAEQLIKVDCQVLQCGAVCGIVWQCVAVCGGVLQCVTAVASKQLVKVFRQVLCCSVLQCVAVCSRSSPPSIVLQCVAVCCSVLQRVAVFSVCCSVWQCVAVRDNVLQCQNRCGGSRTVQSSWHQYEKCALK